MNDVGTAASAVRPAKLDGCRTANRSISGLLERKITRAKISGVNRSGDFDFDLTVIEQLHRL
jgi:hypothetical protein